MAGFRSSILQSCSCSTYCSHHYGGLPPAIILPNRQPRLFNFSSSQCYKRKLTLAYPSASINSGPFVSKIPMFNHPLSSLFSHKKDDKPKYLDVFVTSGVNGNNGIVSDCVDKFRDAWRSAGGADASIKINLYIRPSLDMHPFLIPVSFYLMGVIWAWVMLPRILRRCYKYAMHDPSLQSTNLFAMQVPYEKSFWDALDYPLRYLIIFMTSAKIRTMVASVSKPCLERTWRVPIVLTFLWFLHRLKTNLFSNSLSCQNFGKQEHEKILMLDKVVSGCLIVVGLMGSALAYGLGVYTILIVGGIGGMAIAFATREFFENVCGGLSIQFSNLFSLGDTVKVGSIEGQVVELGLTTTWLLNDEKVPVMVPNSMFFSQGTLNKSRAPWHAMTIKIPIPVDDIDKIPIISNDIESMLCSNPKVLLGEEPPYCVLSQIESSSAELTVGCNLENMNNDELYSMEKRILLQSLLIMKEHGVISTSLMV